ncbi:transglutaminase-like domain-containing protein [Bacteroidota bacterium]
MDLSVFNSLINLLDDKDEEVYSVTSNYLIGQGEIIIPKLEEIQKSSFNELVQIRIEFIVQQIYLSRIKRELGDWVRRGGVNIIEGAVLVAKTKFHQLDSSEIIEQVNLMSRDVWLEVDDNKSVFDKIKVLNQIILDHYGFTGNKSNFIDPYNFFINKSFETKRCSPIIMGIIYIAVAQRLSIPLYGVNLPGNFILAIQNKNEFLNDPSSYIYVNPFNNGRIFKKEEIDKYINQHNLEKLPDFYFPCDNASIIKQLISDLKFIYKKTKDTGNIDCLNVLEEVL